MKTETYGQMIRRLRAERGWTQSKLAEVSGVKVRTIQDIEADKREKPQRGTRLALSRALDIEGNAEEERGEWPHNVQVILDVVGAYLMTMTPEEQLEWLAEITKRAVGSR